jgi:hypothetical protein
MVGKYSTNDPYVKQLAYDYIVKPIGCILMQIPFVSKYGVVFVNHRVNETYAQNGVYIVDNYDYAGFDMPDSWPGDAEKGIKV